MSRAAEGGPILELEIEAQPSRCADGRGLRSRRSPSSSAAPAIPKPRCDLPGRRRRSTPGSPAARAAIALALLDLGRDAEARRQLATLISGAHEHEMSAFEIGGIEDGELERAFEDASPEPEAMHDANEVAFEAMREAELLGPEADPAALGSPFRTRTMASLLESQGDRNAARAIRASLAPRNEAPRSGRRQDDVMQHPRALARAAAAR